MGAQGEAVRERGAFGSAADIRERIATYEAVGLDKFVLWPMAAPDEWPARVEAIGRQIATWQMPAMLTRSTSREARTSMTGRAARPTSERPAALAFRCYPQRRREPMRYSPR